EDVARVAERLDRAALEEVPVRARPLDRDAGAQRGVAEEFAAQPRVAAVRVAGRGAGVAVRVVLVAPSREGEVGEEVRRVAVRTLRFRGRVRGGFGPGRRARGDAGRADARAPPPP